MEQDNNNNFNFDFKCLSANDLSIEHFLTAREDNDDGASSSAGLNVGSANIQRRQPALAALKRNSSRFPHITSSALVDSDNEESFDDINDEGGHTRRAEFVLGDSDEPTLRRADLSAGGASRVVWQRQSLLQRSYALRADNDDDGNHEDNRRGDKSVSYTCDRDKLARAPTSEGGVGSAADDTAANCAVDINDGDEEEASRCVQPVAAGAAIQRRPLGCELQEQLPAETSSQPAILIRIDDTGSRAAKQQLPPAPPPSPLISDTPLSTTIEVGDHFEVCARRKWNALRPIDAADKTGSLSDNTHRRSQDKMALLERRQMEEKLRLWKRSNKIITHLRGENPFSLHLECLEQLKHSPGFDGNISTTAGRQEFHDDKNNSPVANADGSEQQNNNKQQEQQEQLQSYATHLSHLYKKNQTLMDNNSDFRNLLYNIICCLLIQDEQVLSSASVAKMVDVIRTHLESASRFYSAAIMQLSAVSHSSSSSNNNVNNTSDNQNQRRKSSLGSVTSCSTSSNTSSPVQQPRQLARPAAADAPADNRSSLHPVDALLYSQSACPDQIRQSQRPVDFRRISSVSYNDEQLINDLCDSGGGHSSEQTGCGASSASESPWRYEELSSECRHQAGAHQLNQSQSSAAGAENRAAVLVDYFMQHDSGVGTTSCQEAGARELPLRRQRSNQADSNHAGRRELWLGQSSGQTRLSYLSSDDCFTHLHTGGGGGGGDDDSTVGSGHLLNDQQPAVVDVASLKSELEWTLNKLINFELKFTWLTSRDTLRRAIRKVGVPNEIRGKVWLILIDQMIGMKYDAAKVLGEAAKTISREEEQQQQATDKSEDGCDSPPPPPPTNESASSRPEDSEFRAILKQIDLDVNRTMPGHRLFDDGAEGGIKLRRILVAYSIHVNREIAYCQGFNFIVALLLSVFEGHEERALRGFVCIVDHIFPSKFYFDHYLTGARADQFLLADFICDQLIKNPTTAERKMIEGVTSSITLNWFISLFHGAVPTLTRLIILDHFMLEGVKALFRFTMAILYLAFQVTPPSSCEVFHTIRTTARDMYDIKLLLSIVDQIKLPKDSYFAIRRSFYMLQSSFNSDQFYMQSLSQEASKQCVANKPMSLQQMPDTKPPALSLISGSSLVTAMSDNSHFRQQHFSNNNGASAGWGASASGSNDRAAGCGPRLRTSSNRSKVCMQNIGKLGRSHLKIMDANDRSNERSLMSPLRNCLVIGISNCGKSIIVARQSSRKNFKIFREQDLTFYIHELSSEIFDGFYLEDLHIALILTNLGEIYKIDTSKCFADNQTGSAETLMLRSSQASGGGGGSLSGPPPSSHPGGGIENERLKLRLASLDPLTNLLWIYAECEDVSASASPRPPPQAASQKRQSEQLGDPVAARRRALQSNNPFMFDSEDYPSDQQHQQQQQQQGRVSYQRKILIIDVMTFDMFSAFTVHRGFGDIIKLRTSLVAFCQLANPMSSQFSSRIVRIGPTGRYEHLLSFSDVVDFMINLSESHKHQNQQQQQHNSATNSTPFTRNSQRYSSIRKLFNRSVSLNCTNDAPAASSAPASAGTLTRYYRSLIRSQSNAGDLMAGDTNLDDRPVKNDDPSEEKKPAAAEEPKCKFVNGPS